MSFLGLLNRVFDVYRRTAFVLDAVTLSASHSADRTPTEPYLVEVEITGTGTLGTVTVTGMSGGSGDSQDLAFSEAGRLTTTLTFDASTSVTITTSGFTGSLTISARAVKRDGAPVKLLELVRSSEPGRLSRVRGSWQLPRDGSAQVEQPMLFVAHSSAWTPREGDEFVESLESTTWRVEGVPTIDEYTVRHHWELVVQRAEL